MSTDRRRTYLELLGGLDMKLLGQGKWSFTSYSSIDGVSTTSIPSKNASVILGTFTPSKTGKVLIMSTYSDSYLLHGKIYNISVDYIGNISNYSVNVRSYNSSSSKAATLTLDNSTGQIVLTGIGTVDNSNATEGIWLFIFEVETD